MTPRVEVLGVYRVEVDDALVERALALKYEGLDLTEREKQGARADVVEELSGVVLIEVQVRDRDDRFDVGDFQQPDSDQAPYDEAFLSDDGTRVLSRDRAPDVEPLRLAFFMHFFVPALPLQTSYGSVPVPESQPMPARLRDLMPYEPVD
ncbi:MAG TPA: hypothetical protein VFP10_10875 [Candidatus Eisenbacteria bacterium]|nr:hypothetical protein [Candidatus Eisenbacteria bacterium]